MRTSTRKYASGTKIDEFATRQQIEHLLFKRGASDVAAHTNAGAVQIAFAYGGLLYRMTLPMVTDPKEAVKIVYDNAAKGAKRNYSGDEALTKERNRRMRAMLVIVKARMIAVDEGITTFEQEFMPYIVTENQQTVGERIIPSIKRKALEGKAPSALPMKGLDD